MAFLNIVPRGYRIKNETYGTTYHNIQESIPLRVAYGDGVSMTPDVKINVTDLNDGNKTFTNTSGKGDKFKVTVILHQDDEFSDREAYWHFKQWDVTKFSDKPEGLYKETYNLMEYLDLWIRESTVLMVTSSDREMVDIPDGLYVITANPSRKQSSKGGWSFWELEFTKYVPSTFGKFNYTNTYVNKAKKSYENKKKSSSSKKSNKTTKAKESSSLNSKLGKCSLKNLKYSKTKKVTDCTKTLQQYLNKKLGCNLSVDGWYGDATKKQVKAFQTKYKKKYKLNPTGNMDKATLNAMKKV
jgi:hypothetical protein